MTEGAEPGVPSKKSREPGTEKPARKKRAADQVLEYPPSPGALPPGFLATPIGYRLRVIAILLGLLAFVAVYLGLIYVTVMGFPALYSLDLPMRRGTIALMLGGTALLAAILVFLVKGLFHRRKRSDEGLLEIFRDDEPELFRFLDRLIAETGAPRPAHVYVCPDVTAAVFYEPSMLSLVWPVRKNLLLGLGLVNHLTRSELKAILGHELGHFSQRSMKVGSYVYVTGDVVRGLLDPDWFDDALEAASRTDIRIAIVAFGIRGFVWAIRSGLKLLFMALAFGHRSLSREMELAADRVAVSVAGSDAIARGLLKAELADASMAATARALTHAADHGLVTKDFFHHQARIVPEVRRALDKPDWGEIPAGTSRFLFAEDSASKPSMWATHPPSAERERAARARFVEAAHDERPAWTFFRDPEALRERVTAMMRPLGKGKLTPAPPEEVERFLEAEREEARALERFGEMFTGRPLKKLDLESVFASTETPDREALEKRLAAIPLPEVAKLSARFRTIRKEAVHLQRAKAGQIRDDAMIHRKKRFEAAEVPSLLTALDEEARGIDKRFEAIDEELMRVHAAMARQISEDRATTLRRRYALVLRLQAALEAMRAAHRQVMPYLAAMSAGVRLGPGDGPVFLARVEALRDVMGEVLEKAEGRKLPAMENVEAGTDLATFLLPHKIQPRRPEPEAAGPWIGRVLGDAAEIVDKLERLHKKSIAGMVGMLDRIATDWRAQGAGAAAPTA